VLSIEGGGIRGIIPAVVIDFIESYAFQYAVSKKYKNFVKRSKDPGDRRRIQSKELFHMITGTSSSAILTGYLVRPNDPK
jgi:patatin-like phospholipase/acyl hydrolase